MHRIDLKSFAKDMPGPVEERSGEIFPYRYDWFFKRRAFAASLLFRLAGVQLAYDPLWPPLRFVSPRNRTWVSKLRREIFFDTLMVSIFNRSIFFDTLMVSKLNPEIKFVTRSSGS